MLVRTKGDYGCQGGKLVKTGEQIMIGGNEMYVSLCRKHYNDGRIGPKIKK